VAQQFLHGANTPQYFYGRQVLSPLKTTNLDFIVKKGSGISGRTLATADRNSHVHRMATRPRRISAISVRMFYLKDDIFCQNRNMQLKIKS
jgi:hypothetical protein